MSSDLDLNYLRRWIGSEEIVDDELSPALVRRFHATMPLDCIPAGCGEAAPRLIHFCLCQPAVTMADLGRDGHPARGGFMPPVPLPRRMWAGSDISFHGDLFVGDRVRRRSKVDDITVKRGSTGTICFVTVHHALSVDSTLRVEERQRIVYIALQKPNSEATRPRAPMPVTSIPIEVPSPLLFRYSALTFNAHRIHYDLIYAVEVEGYPALIVHGPLQATMLLHLAARLEGRQPDLFTFRGQSPLDNRKLIYLNAGSPVDGTLQLWTSAADGRVAMRAEARWR